MLNRRMWEGLTRQVAATSSLAGVARLTDRPDRSGPAFEFGATVFSVAAEAWRAHPGLHDEHFGPVCVVVRCASAVDLLALAEELPGTLAAAIHAETADLALATRLAAVLDAKAGRIVFDGYPTGVAVTAAMQHGGPYPATTAAAYTSVGTAAIRRFLRPVVYQDAPQALLPAALRDDNPLGILRQVNGHPTREHLAADRGGFR
jgi:NADP-dependent aldehyde dehydrogenase